MESELLVSQVSGKRYRADEQLRSVVSGKTGYQKEFIFCAETKQPLLREEAEKCEVTGKIVMPGLLEQCEVTGKKVLPSELERSAVSGKKALKQFFVSSSLSGARLLEREAVRSVSGKYCVPDEAKICTWSSVQCHPDDIKTCELTGVPIHFKYSYVGPNGQIRFEPLINLLNGVRRKSDRPDLWQVLVAKGSSVLKGNSKVESAELSPDGNHLAVSLEVKDWLGMRTRYAGLLYSVGEDAIDGRIILGKRNTKGWIAEKTL